MKPLLASPFSLLAAAVTLGAFPLAAQQAQLPTADPIIRQMWDEGMTTRSQVYRLAQVLTDSIGPRLTSSPGFNSAVDWSLAKLGEWGITARREQYGTWMAWDRGHTHLDLIAPRKRTLEGRILAWSEGTGGRAVEGDVVVPPMFASAEQVRGWLASVRGKFVALSFPEPTCRPDDNWERLATPESFATMQAERETAREEWLDRLVTIIGAPTPANQVNARVAAAVEDAGALGVLTSTWPNAFGVTRVFASRTDRIPSLDLSCEDYGLVARLAHHDQGPRIRLSAESAFLGEQPAYNVLGEIRGTEKPDEYVVLSAHLDSWDGASGATDNGTGSVMMLEAMRILKATYPNPKRTIILGLWGGEESGLIGSGAFAADHPEVIRGLQAAFNQDNGTWRVDYIRMMGYTEAGAHFGRWFGKLPRQITQHIELDIPGEPERGGSDHMSFICHGAPGFRLQSNYPDYRQNTWHTSRDTFDKIIFDDLRNNATLAAMLAYQASEDPALIPRTQRVLPPSSSGQPQNWPACGNVRRSSGMVR
ncbi:MAG TPA: M20/M25/M40 family metallo-hydrolase [Gemmatimonadales bacterium]|nr:M20/M25/M40 family metallo-hydrolase [Gemmatimonadales bacterium]